MAVSVLLADDHHLVRAGIRALLEDFAQVHVVGEATDGREALELIEKFHPEIVLMDIAMPGLNGLETIAQIRERFPYVRAIVLSMYANEEYVLQALRLGACGYLLKDAAPAEVERAIHAVSMGENYLCPSVSRLVSEYIQRVESDDDSVFDVLSHRQREVLQLIAEGHTTQDIGRILGIHAKTVETHRRNLMATLDIHDIAGLVRYAIRTGLVSADTV
jgi:DNA-binding NarL/FixJ family response regulator